MSRVVTRSPFASYNPSKRVIGSLEMLMIREQEISDLTETIKTCTDRAEKRRLVIRLRACQANLRSWQHYYKSRSPRVKGATINPREGRAT